MRHKPVTFSKVSVYGVIVISYLLNWKFHLYGVYARVRKFVCTGLLPLLCIVPLWQSTKMATRSLNRKIMENCIGNSFPFVIIFAKINELLSVFAAAQVKEKGLALFGAAQVGFNKRSYWHGRWWKYRWWWRKYDTHTQNEYKHAQKNKAKKQTNNKVATCCQQAAKKPSNSIRLIRSWICFLLPKNLN